MLQVLAWVAVTAGLPGDCDADLLSLVSYGGGIYSYGKPYECVRDPARHWCLLSLQSNLSSLNPFFARLQPMGWCVPSSCNASDLVAFAAQRLPALPAPDSAYCWPDDPAFAKWAGWTAAGGVVLGALLALLLAALLVTCLRERREAVAAAASGEGEGAEVALLGVNSGELKAPASGRSGGGAGQGTDWGAVLDLRAAVEELCAPVPPALRALDFVRTASIGLVVLGHVLVFNVVFFANPLDVLADTASAPAALLVVAALGFRAVDTFFFMGALLAAWVVCRRAWTGRRLGGWRAGVFLVAHRLLRVAPLYYTALLLWMFVAPMAAGGPVAWHYAHEHDKCLATWWANLLFVNNFVPAQYGAMCMGWSWYLAVDLQLFVVLGPPLLALLVRFERPWLFLLVVAGPLSAAAVGYSLFWGTRVPYMAANAAGDYNSLVYCKPYARLVPFVCGLGCGGLLAAGPPRTAASARPPLPLLALGHGLALLALLYCALAHLFLVVDPAAAGSEAALVAWSVSYSALYAPMWSAMLAWLAYALYHRLLPELLQRPMEWRMWAVLARLGFGIYLLHPMVLHLREYNRVQLPAMTTVWLLDNFLAVFFASLVLAFALYVLVEYPAGALLKRLLPAPKRA